MSTHALMQTDFPDAPLRRGKVRDVYDLGSALLMISTDRISAFDYILPNPVPDKGRVLTQLSLFWFGRIDSRNHLITANVDQIDLPSSWDRGPLRGRSMLVHKAQVIPIECVVRGYLAGSGWKEYQSAGTVCDLPLPPGLVESDRLPQPIFTPATKAESGHDENISIQDMANRIGRELTAQLQQRSIALYEQCAAYARSRGIIIADTKLEWGWVDGELTLVDEVLTPDSSRFWPADAYQPGRPQVSLDKQFVRDWLIRTGWDRNSPPPTMPDDIIERTRDNYLAAYERITGTRFPSYDDRDTSTIESVTNAGLPE